MSPANPSIRHSEWIGIFARLRPHVRRPFQPPRPPYLPPQPIPSAAPSPPHSPNTRHSTSRDLKFPPVFRFSRSQRFPRTAITSLSLSPLPRISLPWFLFTPIPCIFPFLTSTNAKIPTFHFPQTLVSSTVPAPPSRPKSRFPVISPPFAVITIFPDLPTLQTSVPSRNDSLPPYLHSATPPLPSWRLNFPIPPAAYLLHFKSLTRKRPDARRGILTQGAAWRDAGPITVRAYISWRDNWRRVARLPSRNLIWGCIRLGCSPTLTVVHPPVRQHSIHIGRLSRHVRKTNSIATTSLLPARLTTAELLCRARKASIVTTDQARAPQVRHTFPFNLRQVYISFSVSRTVSAAIGT